MAKCVQSKMKYNISINLKRAAGAGRCMANRAVITSRGNMRQCHHKIERKCWTKYGYRDGCVCVYVCVCVPKPETFQHISANVNCKSFCNCVARNPICLIQFREDKDFIFFALLSDFALATPVSVCSAWIQVHMNEWVSSGCVCASVHFIRRWNYTHFYRTNVQETGKSHPQEKKDFAVPTSRWKKYVDVWLDF